MAEHCDGHSVITGKIGEFSAKIEDIRSNIDRLSEELTDSGKITAKAIADIDNLKNSIRDVKESLDELKERHDTFTWKAVTETANSLESLEESVKELNTYTDSLVTNVTFKDFSYNIQKELEKVYKSLSDKASTESVKNCKEWACYALGISVAISSVIAKFLLAKL